MEEIINQIIGAVLQLLAFALIPFIVYLVRFKKVKGFPAYLGLRRSTRKANLHAVAAASLFAGPVLILLLASSEFKEILLEPTSITGKFHSMGFSIESLVLVLIMAGLKTSFTEEVLFRGFIAKRLIALWGFRIGNGVHAALFGIVHTLLFAQVTSNIAFLVVIFVLPTIGAYVSAYINEKLADGSIIPGWISHGLANVTAYSVVGFLV